jgi:hypothetical protein
MIFYLLQPREEIMHRKFTAGHRRNGTHEPPTIEICGIGGEWTLCLWKRGSVVHRKLGKEGIWKMADLALSNSMSYYIISRKLIKISNKQFNGFVRLDWSTKRKRKFPLIPLSNFLVFDLETLTHKC